MSCKLLLSLVDCIYSKADNVNKGRELLMRMLEVIVLKFKTIAKIQLPILMSKCKQQQQNAQNAASASEVKTESGLKSSSTDMLDNTLGATQNVQKDEKAKFGLSQNDNYNIADYRSLVKALVYVVKSINCGYTTSRVSTSSGVRASTDDHNNIFS